MSKIAKCLFGWCLLIGFFSCQQPDPANISPQSLFTRLPPEATGIDFENNLEYTEAFNPYTYRNFYNGGGVAIGDVNNDGLADLYFCGNMRPNKLYLNKGNFQFEDITKQAGVACEGVWSSGVSMADVNGDGWLDIYVCKSGSPDGNNRNNELFINQGDLTFTEQSAAWGIDDLGLSTHAVFFDYDKDGDLDCYLLNNSIRSVGGYDIRKDQRKERDPQGGNKLYRNELIRSDGAGSATFTDVSEEAGIYGSMIGFGLGVTVGDVDRDGWQDIYVSNDFFERDYLYINQQDGTYKEVLEERMREISLSSMGADMADINNDGAPEIFVTDMLPGEEARLKTKTVFENWDKYQLNVKNGYFHQFSRNALQLNHGDGVFSEIGRMANVYATDWSWGALIVDLDNDGWKDIFVANGIYKDLTDQDYINFYSDPNTVRAIMEKKEGVIETLIDQIPSEAVPNYVFRNNGDLTFTNVAEEWGMGMPSFSNGSAYGDLDNDGDMDLVTNNVNMPAFLFRNETSYFHPERHFLQFRLSGNAKNTAAFGTQITVYANDRQYYHEHIPMKGFQSSVDPLVHIGLGSVEEIDSVVVLWPDSRKTVLLDASPDQVIALKQEDAGKTVIAETNISTKPLFTDVTTAIPLEHRHQENEFVDFDRDRLIFQMLSAEGPCMEVIDIDGNGYEDIFIGGAKNQAAAMYLQLADGSFQSVGEEVWKKDQSSEDTDCAFFDADGDGDPDLLVTSGGYEYSSSSSALADRLYINLGKGRFERKKDAFQSIRYSSSSCVAPADWDRDGDIDLFIGTRLKPFLYGVPVSGYLLENKGTGQFVDVSEEKAPGLNELGMITDAAWLDTDQDGDQDLVVVGEWMGIQYFENNDGRLIKTPTSLEQASGFWNEVEVADLDGDGLEDLLLGNHGWNTRLKAGPEQPVEMYVNDFDGNGTAEHIICTYNSGASYPLALRHDMVMQMPILKKKYLKYEDYKLQQITDMFPKELLDQSVKWEVRETGNAIAWNQNGQDFELTLLPREAQLSPLYSLLPGDFNGDGIQDLLAGGNFYRAKPEIGKYDASYGCLLLGLGNRKFEALSSLESGIRIRGEIRQLARFSYQGQDLIAVALNDDRLRFLRWKK